MTCWQDILFTDGFCSGSHGLSIGSVGGRSNNEVRNVTFSNSRVVDSQQAIRIKTISGATGSVTGVTYRNVTFAGITKYGIVVDQSYNGDKGQPTNGVLVSDFVLEDVEGTVRGSATNVYINCGSGSCRDWRWSEVRVSGGTKRVQCQNAPAPLSC